MNQASTALRLQSWIAFFAHEARDRELAALSFEAAIDAILDGPDLPADPLKDEPFDAVEDDLDILLPTARCGTRLDAPLLSLADRCEALADHYLYAEYDVHGVALA